MAKVEVIKSHEFWTVVADGYVVFAHKDGPKVHEWAAAKYGRLADGGPDALNKAINFTR